MHFQDILKIYEHEVLVFFPKWNTLVKHVLHQTGKKSKSTSKHTI